MDRGDFILDTDASDVGMGAVLSQFQDGVERVIIYFSKTFSKCEIIYCVTRRELLAIVCSVKYFHHYVNGRPFLVRSDHGSLRWLINFRNPEGQLARWLQILSAYDYTIVHRPGRVHSNADALSRRPCSANCSHCSKRDNKESLRVSTVGVELNNDNPTMTIEGKVHGERQGFDKRSEKAAYAGDQSRQEVHYTSCLREIFVYKLCPTLGINSNSERCLN
jgi:hypothetical protein